MCHGQPSLSAGVLAALAVPATVAEPAVLAPSRRAARWTAIALTAAALLAIASVGLFFVPTVALAWVAARQPGPEAMKPTP